MIIDTFECCQYEFQLNLEGYSDTLEKVDAVIILSLVNAFLSVQ